MLSEVIAKSFRDKAEGAEFQKLVDRHLESQTAAWLVGILTEAVREMESEIAPLEAEHVIAQEALENAKAQANGLDNKMQVAAGAGASDGYIEYRRLQAEKQELELTVQPMQTQVNDIGSQLGRAKSRCNHLKNLIDGLNAAAAPDSAEVKAILMKAELRTLVDRPVNNPLGAIGYEARI